VTKKILIVDDEPNIVTALEYLLQKNGYEVLLAQDGDAALRQVGKHLPDLVLLDVMMSLKSGYEVCQRMRERADWQHIKIVMLSAKGREAEVSKGLSLGADLYVTKPFSNQDLIARINELLGQAGKPGGA
jgi:DNA-binding response OmpR family regulator